MRLKRHLGIALLASFVTSTASADVIISNFSASAGAGTVFGGGSIARYKAFGFTMGPQAKDLGRVVLTMDFPNASPTPIVSIWDDAGGTPGVEMLTLDNPALLSGPGDYAFTTSSAFTLQANTTYWVHVRSEPTSGPDFWWQQTTPSTLPSGASATAVGYLLNGSPSTYYNRIEVHTAGIGLCTLFARNNGGSIGGAVYFDVTAFSDVDIWGFDINTFETTPAGLEVWATLGTYVGNENNVAVWTQVAVDDGTGMGMGADIPTPITLAGGGFTLPAGAWGMALVAVGVGHDYTTGGAGSTLQYSDGTITIDLGAATNVPFTGSVFAPRIWNGCIHYDRGEPGTPYCFGDPGSGTPCPCGNDNDGSLPGSGCDNGVFASGARLSGYGVARITNDTLVLLTTGLEPNNWGLYFQADNIVAGGDGSPFGDGLRCAGGNLQRLQPRPANGSGVSFTTIVISTKAGNISPGDTKRYQCWYRTQVNPPCGSGVNDFNLSNGYEITWLP